jgi:putative transposase
MRNPLERRYGQGELHFVTFSCVQRKPLLGTPAARDYFVHVFDEIRTRYEFLLIGYVVMPEHVHLLISEPAKGNLSKVLQVLKQQVARKLLKINPGNEPSPATHFWMRRFYDFNVWSGDKITEKLQYMHMNPVKRDLVPHPSDWAWSSWAFYTTGEQGLISIDRWEGASKENLNPHP